MPRFNRLCTSNARLNGKTAVITGANTGIGKETALELVKRGARVILACRDLNKAEEAAKDIRKQCADLSGKGEVLVVKLDLSSLNSVRDCAKKLLETEQHINLLINNAAVLACPKTKTEDGFDMQFQVNHLGHFLFTCLLLPRIITSAPARIINLSSVAHIGGRIDFGDLNSERSYSPSGAYAQSKLANVLFTLELSERLRGTGVTVYAVNPGIVQTEIWRNLDKTFPSGTKWLVLTTAKFFFKTPNQGAQTSVYCAVDENAASESGCYYYECKRKTPSRRAQDREVAKKLWTESVRLAGIQDYNPFSV